MKNKYIHLFGGLAIGLIAIGGVLINQSQIFSGDFSRTLSFLRGPSEGGIPQDQLKPVAKEVPKTEKAPAASNPKLRPSAPTTLVEKALFPREKSVLKFDKNDPIIIGFQWAGEADSYELNYAYTDSKSTSPKMKLLGTYRLPRSGKLTLPKPATFPQEVQWSVTPIDAKGKKYEAKTFQFTVDLIGSPAVKTPAIKTEPAKPTTPATLPKPTPATKTPTTSTNSGIKITSPLAGAKISYQVSKESSQNLQGVSWEGEGVKKVVVEFAKAEQPEKVIYAIIGEQKTIKFNAATLSQKCQSCLLTVKSLNDKNEYTGKYSATTAITLETAK